MAISTEIQEFVERAVARAKAQTVTIVETRTSEVSSLQKWLESHPVIPITFWSLTKEWIFTTEQSDWTFGSIGSISYGSPAGATITVPPAEPMAPPEYATLCTYSKWEGTGWEFDKLTYNANISLSLLQEGALNTSNEIHKEIGDFIVRLGISGYGTVKIRVEYSGGSSAEQITDISPSGGIDVLVEEEGDSAVVKFRSSGGGSWTTHCTIPYQLGIGVVSVGVKQAFYEGDTHIGTVYSVERTSLEPPSGSFIPTMDAGDRAKDYIYACNANNEVYEIVPEEGMVVYDKGSGFLYVWSGSVWDVYGIGLPLVKNVITKSRTVISGYSMYVPDFLEIAGTCVAEIGADSVLEVG